MNKIKKALLIAMSFTMSACMFVGCLSADNSSTKDSTPETSSTESVTSETPAESVEDETSEAPEESVEDETSEEPEESVESVTSEAPVVDEEAPVFGDVDETQFANLAPGAKITIPTVTATDNVDSEVVINVMFGNAFRPMPTEMGAEIELTFAGNYVIIYSATDAAGNYAEKTINVSVVCEHDFSVGSINADYVDPMYHWVQCSKCGEKDLDSVAEHVIEWTTTEETHTGACDCGYTLEAEAHAAQGVYGEENWNYCECGVQVCDDDLAGSIVYFDRLNKNLVKADGNLKNNKANYWDGAENIVSVSTQKTETNGSTYATKVSFDLTKFTQEQLTEATTEATSSWAGWGKEQLWVGYAIPVNGMDLTNYELVLDAKMVNMNTKITAYAAIDYEGELDAVYAVGVETYFEAADAVALENGWYRYTITIDCTNGVGKAADYIILSLDNTASGYDKTKESVAYIDNVSLTEVIYYTVTVDGEEQEVRAGETVTLTEPTKEGYKFLGWVNADGNGVNATFTATEDITITSTWEKLPTAVKANATRTYIDLSKLPQGTMYEEVSFTAPAGTYYVTLTGGIKAYTIENGVMTENEITQFVYEEETTTIFAITYGWDDENIYADGTVSIISENTDGLEASKVVAQMFAGAWDYPIGSENEAKRAFVNCVTPTAVTEGIPEGYTSLSRFDWYQESTSMWKAGGNPLYRSIFNQTDISSYTVVRFMFKLETSGDAVVEFGNGSTTNNEWLTVQLTQTSAGVWTMVVIGEDGSVLYGASDIVRDGNGTKDVDCIASLAFPRGWVDDQRTHALLLKPCSSTEMTASIYSTEIYGWKEPFVYDPQISDEAVAAANAMVELTDNEWKQAKVNEDLGGVTAPNGFSKVYRLDSKTEEETVWTSSVYGANNFDKTDLSGYSEVWFAAQLVNARWVFVGGGADVMTPWVYFHLTQTSANVWTIEVTVDGVTHATIENQDGTHMNSNQPVNSIARLLWDGGYGSSDGNAILIYHLGSGVASIYTTEVVGVEKPVEPFDPAIPEEAAVVRESIWRLGGYALSTSTDEPAPTGFTNVKEYDWLNNTTIVNGAPWGSTQMDMPLTCFDETLIDGYTAIYFAMKLEGGTGFYVRGAGKYTGTDWLYYYFTKAEDDTWSLTLKSADGKYVAENVQTGIVATNLEGLLRYHASTEAEPWNTGAYPTKSVDSTTAIVYMTDMRAIEEPFVFELPDNAVAVRSYIWRDDKYALSASTEEPVPAGYTSIVEHVWASNHTTSYTYCYDDTTDISGYSDLYFAIKNVNAEYTYINGGTWYYGSDWLYVHYTQAADGTWSFTVNAYDGFKSATNKTITGTNLKALTASYLYGCRKDTTLNTKSYYTEVYGVAKSAWGEKVIDSAVDGATPSTVGVGVPYGFTGAYEMKAFTLDKFAAFDLTNTTYEELRFGMIADVDFAFKAGYGYTVEGETEARPTTTIMSKVSNRAVMNLVTLTKNEDGSWHVTINCKRWAAASTTIADSKSVQTEIPFEADVTGNSVNAIMNTILMKWAEMTVYVTEVRGIAAQA